jgi:phosphoglycolate phosphatase
VSNVSQRRQTRIVLFDLDGTVSDSASGILGSLRLAFEAAGLPPLTPEQARPLLGPPFYESLPPLIGFDRVAEVITAYRGFYAAGGMYDTAAYDGVGELLEWLHELGVTMAVATSKPEHFALPIVEHLGLARCFTAICGDTLDGARATKALVVGEVLRRLGDPDPATVVMVGDRSHDVLGAAAHGIGCLGVGWGYGGVAELTRAGALEVCAAVANLRGALTVRGIG